MPTNTDEQAVIAALQAEATATANVEAQNPRERLGLPAEFGVRTLHPKQGDKRPMMVMFRMQASFPFAFEFITADAAFITRVAKELTDIALEMSQNPDNAEYNNTDDVLEEKEERLVHMEQNQLGMRTYRPADAVEVATDSTSNNSEKE